MYAIPSPLSTDQIHQLRELFGPAPSGEAFCKKFVAVDLRKAKE